MIKHLLMAASSAMLLAWPGHAVSGSAEDGYDWLARNDEILREGIFWNDRLGDGKDRYKTGGLTQSWVIPEARFGETRWFGGFASALEIQARGFIATPDNTAIGGNPGDRPFAQYAGLGLHLRTISEPERVNPVLTYSAEQRLGIELGYQGDPLPLLDLQEQVHDGNLLVTSQNSIDGEVLVNLEARRTARFQFGMSDADVDFAPFAQLSAGMRENSVRIGGDILYGTALEGRTWNTDPAIGALIPGGSMPRRGVHWALWGGGDIGYVASDAFLDGGFAANGPSVARERLTGRLRLGLLVEIQPVTISYSLNWLSPEFKAQPQSQVIGAISLKLNF